MSEVQTRSRKEYRRRTAVESGDDSGYEFAEWLTGQVMESYVKKIHEYCVSMSNCELCTFFNGTCRLNRYPWDWDTNIICDEKRE